MALADKAHSARRRAPIDHLPRSQRRLIPKRIRARSIDQLKCWPLGKQGTEGSEYTGSMGDADGRYRF